MGNPMGRKDNTKAPGARSSPRDSDEPANMGFRVTRNLITAREWEKLPGVIHGFSTRHSNRREFFARFSGHRVPLKQIHSDVAHAVESPPAKLMPGDALLTNRPGLALEVKTADCLPILLFDPAVPAIAAVHAGWRGTVRRIAQKTAGALRKQYGADPARTRALIGPGIRACCYQVGEGVLEEFRAQFAYAEELFRGLETENPADVLLPRQTMFEHQGLMRGLAVSRARLDLEEANRRQLIEAGLNAENIITGAPCTACRLDLLYSYRREGAAAGRLFAAIQLA